MQIRTLKVTIKRLELLTRKLLSDIYCDVISPTLNYVVSTVQKNSYLHKYCILSVTTKNVKEAGNFLFMIMVLMTL